MTKRFASSENGLTLIELLVSLSLVGIISAMIISYFSTGLNSFRNVNEKISLHDEANYVMRMFENEILEATEIAGEENLYTITKMNGDTVTFGFKNSQAVINDAPLHTSRAEITDESSIEAAPGKNYVIIKLKMKDQSDNTITLENRIPYINIKVVD